MSEENATEMKFNQECFVFVELLYKLLIPGEGLLK